jgi:putative ABC transport system permease protein
MTRTSRLSTPGLLGRHLSAGISASLLVALLITAAVFAVALAPRGLIRLGTAELRHELGGESHAVLDLTGTGTLGIPTGLPSDAPLDDIVGKSDETIRGILDRLPRPLQDHAGPVEWVVLTKNGDGFQPVQLPLKLSMALAADLDWMSRITFVDGTPPTAWEGNEFSSDPTVVQPPIPVAISTDAAEQLQLKVGDQIGYSPAPAVVAGVYELNDPGDPYWVHEENLARVTFEKKQGELPTARLNVYVDPGSLAGLPSAFQIGKLSAFIPIEPSGFDYAEAAEIQTQVRQVQATQVALPFFGNLGFRSGLPDVIDRAVQRVTSASALLALSVSGLLGVLLAVFALGVQSVISRRRPALALAAARGAGALQLRSAMVLEGLLLSVPGAALGLGGAVLLLPGEVGLEGWIVPIALALAPPVLFGVMTSPRRLRDPRGDLQVRSRSRVRWIAEVAVAGLAVLSLFLLARRGLVASSAAVGIDPLLAATPLLLAAAVCIGVLRLYPAPLRAVQRLLRRRRGSTGVLGAARAIRDPALGFAAALALVVGISVVVFSVVMATTMRAGLVQGAQDTIGADIQVHAQDLPSSVIDGIGEIDGVREAVAVAMVTGVDLAVDADSTEVLVVLADTAAMHEVRPDLPDLSAKDDGGIPVLVSSDWVDRIPDVSLNMGGTPLVQAGVIRSDAIPGATRHFVYVDSAFAGALGVSAADPERAFVRLAAGASAAEVAAQIEALVTPAQQERYRGLVDVLTADALLTELRSSPTVSSIESALLIAAAASLLLTMLTVVLASVAAATARNRLVGVLRILGMSPRQLRAIQAWELGPVAITAVVVGTLLGLALPFIVTSALDLRPFVGGQAQPGPAVDPVWLLAAVGAFVLVVVLAGVVAAALGRRFAPAGTLKMGEG